MGLDGVCVVPPNKMALVSSVWWLYLSGSLARQAPSVCGVVMIVVVSIAVFLGALVG